MQKLTPCTEKRGWVEQRAQNIFQERVILGEILREIVGILLPMCAGLKSSEVKLQVLEKWQGRD